MLKINKDSDMENRDPLLEASLAEKSSFFQIRGTPPEEKRRALRAAQLAASQEVSILLLTPFTQIPKVSFDRIKLGSSGVRQLVVRNPGNRPLEVLLERLPKEEKGFAVDFTCFRLGGHEETTVLVGWTPRKGGSVREYINVKFGGFRSQIILIGSCLAPEEKPVFRGVPSFGKKPLGPKNTNAGRGRGAPAGKSKAAAPQKITIPLNPVERKSESPPKRSIPGQEGEWEDMAESTVRVEPSSGEPTPSHVRFDNTVPDSYAHSEGNSRRETFVRERPSPAPFDVMESTPKQNRSENIRDRTSRLSCIPHGFDEGTASKQQFMPPPNFIPPDRRQTFVPEKEELRAVVIGECFDESDSKEGSVFNLTEDFPSSTRRDTYLKVPLPFATPSTSWTPQKLGVDAEPTERKKWTHFPPPALKNMAALKDLNETEEVDDVTRANDDSSCMDTKKVTEISIDIDKMVEEMSGDVSVNLSLSPDSGRPAESVTSPSKEGAVSSCKPSIPTIVVQTAQDMPLNLSVKKSANETQNVSAASRSVRYQPEVSDISLPEGAENLSLGSPFKAPVDRAALFEEDQDDPGSQTLDASYVGPDMSMAVNVSAYYTNRESELDEELAQCERLDNDNDHDLDAEIERLAEERATSNCRDEIQEEDQDERRLSSVTVVKSAPSLHSSYLPDVSQLLDEELQGLNLDLSVNQTDLLTKGNNCYVEVRNTKCTEEEEVVIEQKEIVREEVIEEVIEYEYEIIGNERRLVGERNMGKSVTVKETEVNVLTPRKIKHTRSSEVETRNVVRESNCDISKMIENQLCTLTTEKIPRAASLSEKEIDGMIGMLSLSEEKSDSGHSNTKLQMAGGLVLPGLCGSPRVSNQNLMSSESFLCRTVCETSFLPPNPDDPRRCSTGVKAKEASFEVVAPGDIKKSLFKDEQTTLEVSKDEGFDDVVPLSSGGHMLPVIPEPNTAPPNCRLSSDTYVACGDNDALSTIQELDECSQPITARDSTNNEKSETVSLAPPESTASVMDDEEKEQEQRTKLKERTPARARRSNVKYVVQPIEDIAKDPETETTTTGPKPSSGLLFLAISPGTREKRKSEEHKRPVNAWKKMRPSLSAATHQPRRPKASVADPRAVKDPATKRPASVPARAAVARAQQPARKLSLVTKSAPRRSNVVHHPNPFAAKNMYYDERWVEKQERGFTNWLNFILTPQSLEDTTTTASTTTATTVDVAKLWSQCSADVKVPRAPTREVMSMRAYTARREMNRLRRAACRIWQSREVAGVIRKLEIEIEKMRLLIRKDRHINKDIGMKQAMLLLMLSYNPLWLRIGLETIFGELLQLHSNTDLLGLSRFLLNRLLSNPDILSEFAHPTVPHSYREGHQDALKKFTLKKFLELVYFLDFAKESRMIRHDPCLFSPESKYKSSREMLIAFSRDYLSGEGDVIKHLAYFGYEVRHKQTKLQEFDYAVTSISTDLRCGLRLTKVAELLTGASLSHLLRVPVVSRLQKVHNTDVGLKCLKSAAGGPAHIPTNIAAKDLVDGHREKTLQLLWGLIFGFQLSAILDVEKLREEIGHLRKSLRVKARLGDANAKKGLKFLEEANSRSPPGVSSLGSSEDLAVLKEWAQLVAAHYDIQIENFTVSWCDGRGLCSLVHHYQPALLNWESVEHETTRTSQASAASLDDSLDFCYGQNSVDSQQYSRLLDNEKINFRLLLAKVNELGGVPVLINADDMSNTIPDEKVTATFIGYLAVRLLDISREIKATRVIQLAWRKYFAGVKEKRLKVMNEAAKTIQRNVRIFLQRRKLMKYERAALVLQKHYRGYRDRRIVRQMILEIKHREWMHSIVKIQSVWRGKLCRKRIECYKRGVVGLQAAWRGWKARQAFLRLRNSVMVCQSVYRAKLHGKLARQAYLEKRLAAVKLQSVWRSRVARISAQARLRDIVTVQAVVRGHLARRKYAQVRRAITTCQAIWRAKQLGQHCRTEYLKQRSAAVKLQSVFRMTRERRRFLRLKQVVTRIQAVSRGRQVRRHVAQKLGAVQYVQARWRAVLAMRQQRKAYLDLKVAATTIQSQFRMQRERSQFVQMKTVTVRVQAAVRRNRERRLFLERKRAAEKIQQFWRGWCKTKEERANFLRVKSSAVKIQSTWRMYLARRNFLQLRKSAICLQKNLRMILQRKTYVQYLTSCSTIQAWYRGIQAGNVARQSYLVKKARIIHIQATWRMLRERKRFSEKRRAAIILQSYVRMNKERKKYIAKRAAAILLQKWCRGIAQGRAERGSFLRLKESAIYVQSQWRMLQQKRIYNQVLRSAIVLQKNYRRKIAVREYSKKRVSAVKIQSWYRSITQTRAERREFLAKKSAATTVQSAWRCFVARRQFQDTKAKTILIQSHVRSLIAVRIYRRQREAIICLQTAVRARSAMKVCRENFHTMRSGFVALQAVVRARQVRREYICLKTGVIALQSQVRMRQARGRFVKVKQSAIVVQRTWRAILEGRRTREEYMDKKSAAITIQAWWRGVVYWQSYNSTRGIVIFLQSHVRRYQAEIKYRRTRAAIVAIQNYYRSWTQMKTERLEYLSLRASAVRIQNFWRGFQARQKFKHQLTKITTIQKQVRGFLARRLLSRMRRLNIEHSSALKIQCFFRQFKSRQELEALKRQLLEKNSATAIQTYWRKYAARKQFVRLRQAATYIQQTWRNKVTARVVRQQFLTQRSAAVQLQSWWRGLACRQRYLLDKQRIVKCQATWRMAVQRRRYLRTLSALATLQKYLKSTLAARVARHQFLVQKAAAIKVQSWWRMKSEQKQYSIQLKRIVALQALARGRCARQNYIRIKSAAVLLQQHYRNRMAGRKQRETYTRLRSAAVTIQRLYRERIRQRAAAAYLHSVITCQSAVRRYLSKVRCTEIRRRNRDERAATLIQAFVKGAIERRRYLRIKSSSVKIQNWLRILWEAKKVRVEFTKLKGATVAVQSRWRMILCRREYLKYKTSAVVIQKYTRRHLAMKEFSVKLSSCCTIQRYWRAFVATRQLRSQYLAQRAAAVTIQSWWRGKIARAEFTAKCSAVLTIQKYVRGLIARRYVTRKKRALSTIQNAIKCYNEMKQQRRSYHKLRTSIIGIQTLCRAYLARRNCLKLREDAEYRELLRQEAAHLEEERRNQAAGVLGRAVRLFIVRRRIAKRVAAVVTIQKFWRGRRVRLELREKWRALTQQLEEIRGRLSLATASARPEDRLGTRTASAIDYIFSIKDVGDLICAVKTLDVATRLSQNCCMQMAVGEDGNRPLRVLVSLMTRCNRSVPHMEVISTTLDVLINIARVDATRPGLVSVPNLLSDLFQTMCVFRDAGPVIFSKLCALMQILSVEPEVKEKLTTGNCKTKLLDHETRVGTKQKLKEQNMKRRSFNASAMPPPMLKRKPLRPNTTLNTTTASGSGPSGSNGGGGGVGGRKGSTSLASSAPWCPDARPRYHEDPLTAIHALVSVLKIAN